MERYKSIFIEKTTLSKQAKKLLQDLDKIIRLLTEAKKELSRSEAVNVDKQGYNAKLSKASDLLRIGVKNMRNIEFANRDKSIELFVKCRRKSPTRH